MSGNEGIDEMAGWEPKPCAGLPSDANEYGHPTVVFRTPGRLVRECEDAFDAGLLLAALTLVVTIPDVCANIDGTDYRRWCERYLGLVNDGKKMAAERKADKRSEEVEKGFEAIEGRGVFTASDLYQLRCAVVHAGSSVIEGKGEEYSPYRAIRVCVQGSSLGIIAGYGHTGTGHKDHQEHCAYDCSIRLEGLISLMAKGVHRFIEEDPARDYEYPGGSELFRQGVVDYRSLMHLHSC